MRFKPFDAFNKIPIVATHKHIHAIAAASGLGGTTALITEPSALPIFIIKSVTIFTAT
jgi:hypothetical protein